MVYIYNNKYKINDDNQQNLKKIKYDYNTVRKLVLENNNIDSFVIKENKKNNDTSKKIKYNFEIN